MKFRRYAIYHLPGGELGRFGDGWLGWDVRLGQALPRPEVQGLPDDPRTLTAAPMRYGFHATLKAPFRLAEGRLVQDLEQRIALICDQLAPFALQMELRQDWGFVALRPRVQPPRLLALEQALVTRLDDLRAPLTADERARRRPEMLPETALQHLDRWGYPFVLDLFGYHLTLSGALPSGQSDQLHQALLPVLAPLIAAPMPVPAVALVGEDQAGRFHLIREFALRG